MTRRHRGKTQLGVSLFPFLAVLICTMGALIVLLLLVMQQAQVQAKQVAASQPTAEETAAAAAKLAIEREDAQWRRDALAEQRAKKAEELADQRLALSHLEDHIRRLQEQWQDLESQAAQLQSQGSEKQHSHEKVAGEIAAVREQIEAAKSELDSARANAKGRPRSFSIIPYDGPNGTSRRPIYVECTGERILIQPEGVALDARDFQGPLGPGNSLDACLRAIREYLARSPDHAKVGEPYPLLIVRPGGIVAYAAARSAMKSWEDEFGYELVEDDTVLAYPQPDPTLKRLLERAIVEARRRQLMLAAAAPSRYRVSGGPGGQPFGGFEALMADDPYVQNPGAGDGGSFGGTGTGKGSGQPGDIGGESTGQRGPRGAAGSATSGGFYSPNYRGGSRGSNSTARSENVAESGTSANSQTGAGKNTAGQAVGGRGAAGQAASGQRGNGPSGRVPPGAQGFAGPAISSADSESGSDASNNSNASSHKPIAHQRGANWGLPNYSQRAVGITRPVRVRVSADQLEILPERGTAGAIHKVPIRDSMSLATQHLVEQIGEEVNGWGIAVSNGYWKPVLNIETAPGGEARVAELETLLQGSGLGLRRK